jgi:hypothetical protein
VDAPRACPARRGRSLPSVGVLAHGASMGELCERMLSAV